MKHKKLIIFTGFIGLILILNYVFGWSSYLGDRDNLKFLSELAEDHIVLAMLLYTVITIIGCVVLALPGVTFAILAGVLFGPWLGTFCCSFATSIGAVLAFLVSRFFLKDSIKPMIMKNKYLNKMLFSGKEQNKIFILMITRLVPLFPFNLQNFAYGITDIRFGTYTVYSFLFMLPGTAMYTLGTAGFLHQENRIFHLVMAVLIAILVIGAGRYFRKKYVGADESEHESGKQRKNS